MLDEPESRILRLQVQLGTFHRHLSGRTIEFHYRKLPPSIRRLANCQVIHHAVLTVRGRISGFSTVVTVRLAKGILSSLEFDMIPWAAHEPLEIEVQFADFVESVANGGTSPLRQESTAIPLRIEVGDGHPQRGSQFQHLEIRNPANSALDARDDTAGNVPASELTNRSELLLRPTAFIADKHHLSAYNVSRGIHSPVHLSGFGLGIVRYSKQLVRDSRHTSTHVSHGYFIIRRSTPVGTRQKSALS